MEIFKNTNFDFLGKKMPFIIVSLVLIGAGVASLAVKGGPRYGIDFRGGALMSVQFAMHPPIEKIRSLLSSKIKGEISVVNVTSKANQVLIGTEIQQEQTLNANRDAIVQALEANFGGNSGKLDLNNVGVDAVVERLQDPAAASRRGDERGAVA